MLSEETLEFYLNEFKPHEKILPGHDITCHAVLNQAKAYVSLVEKIKGINIEAFNMYSIGKPTSPRDWEKELLDGEELVAKLKSFIDES